MALRVVRSVLRSYRPALEVPAVGVVDWLSIELLATGISPGCGSKEVRASETGNQECPPRSRTTYETRRV